MTGLLPDPITLDDLKANLRLELDFEGWSYGDRSNELTVRIMYGDESIDQQTICIEPVGFQRED